MDLTTAARVKVLLNETGSTLDTTIAQLITGISGRMERYMNRHADSSAARTEYFDLMPGQRRIFLKGVPVTSVTSIHNDPIDQSFGTTTLIASTNYVTDLQDGSVTFHQYRPLYGAKALKVISTGGLAASAAAIITTYPEIALACDWQVVHEFHNRMSPGASSVGIGGASVALVSGLDWLPTVKQTLDGYRRMAHT